MHEYTCFDPDWEALNAHCRFATEDEYWETMYDAKDRADSEARQYAEGMADMIDFDSDEERDAYIEEEYNAEYERLLEEYEKAL